jgi:hypothetical protein
MSSGGSSAKNLSGLFAFRCMFRLDQRLQPVEDLIREFQAISLRRSAG